ncbi:MAG: transglutaminase-like domain-containing protein [Oscillospiraceae bacterium]|nr:transglutaminase-like domain-containing protein [Oscillospiraceae bacterium]
MNIKKILSDHLYFTFFALCAVVLLESSLLSLALCHHAPLAVSASSLVSMAAVLFIYLNRKNAALYAGLVAVTVLTMIALHAADIPAASFILNTVNHLFSGKALRSGETIFAASVFSLLLTALMFPLSRIRTARYIISASCAGFLVLSAITGYTQDFPGKFAAAGLIISTPAELCLSSAYKKESRTKLNSVMSFLLPLFMLFSLITALIPSSDKPISWSLIKNLASCIVEKTQSLITDISILLHPETSEFSISMQGYSDADNVFGYGLSGEASDQLIVSFSKHPRSSVYLIGNVSDTYTGSGWGKNSSTKFSKEDYYLDYCETMLAFERAGYSIENLSDFTDKKTVTVIFDDMSTRSLFYPLKTMNISSGLNYDASSENVIFDSRAKKSDEYRVTYYEINYHSKQFLRILNDHFTYNESKKYTKHQLDRNIPDNIEEILSQRSDYIKQTYTIVPENVTERTYSLALSITEDCTDDYDKLCAIEAYLNRYTYTKTPGGVPDGYDPVDYFLYESKSGYCTYFASAMTLLARCAGIPARYVQGFCVNSDLVPSDNNYHVEGTDAHAWTEAYIEGVGWIPFEPTSSYSDTRYFFDGKPETAPQSSWSDYEKHHYDDDTFPEFTDVSETENNSNAALYIIIALTVLLGIVLTVFLYIAIRMHIFKRKYNSCSDTDKFIICFKMSLFMCEKYKTRRWTGETIDHYCERIIDMDPDDQISFALITPIFDRIRYGEGEALPDETCLIEKYLGNIFEQLKIRRSRVAALTAFVLYCVTR